MPVLVSGSPLLRWVLAATLVAGASSGAQAQSENDESAAYYYDEGRQAAERVSKGPKLSQAQVDELIRGFTQQLTGKPSAYTDDEVRQSREHVRELEQAQMEELGRNNQLTGEKYMAELEKDLRYSFLGRGLAYRVEVPGTGPVPHSRDQVRLRYTGRHLDGSVFDSREEAEWMPLPNVLPGWRVALQQMQAGSRWTLVVPPHLAYGERGAGERIGPYETLIYELELVDIR